MMFSIMASVLSHLGLGSNTCLGWYDWEQSCENESLCSGLLPWGWQ